VARPEEIVGAIDIAKEFRRCGAQRLGGTTHVQYRQTIMERVVALGLPAMFQSPEIQYGGLIAYGARFDQLIETLRLANWLCWCVEHE
jgi:hypothetical protein